MALAREHRRVGGASTVGLSLAGDLKAAIWVHAINEPIWITGGKTVKTGRESFVDLETLGVWQRR